MLKKYLYFLWIVIFVVFALYIVKFFDSENLLNSIENKTFDLRQSMIVNSGYRKPNRDIVIVAIDDASYEYVTEKYGDWPVPREIYAKVAEYIEAQHPKAIAFDLMFVNSLKSTKESDDLLIDIFKKYNNVFTAMNFDNQSEDLRKPVELPDKYSIDIKNLSANVNLNSESFTNCRPILQGIMNSTSNIGMINVSRAEDGVIRKMPVVLSYQNKYYPQLAFKVASFLVGSSDVNYTVSKNSKLLSGSRTIFLDRDGNVILNWYGGAGTYAQVPFYSLIQSLDTDKYSGYFKDKIVYFGTTASSLFDIKTTPVSRIYPGVEIQATYVNNFLDNNFIVKIDKTIVFVFAVILALITGISVFNITSAGVVSFIFLIGYGMYIFVSYFLMKYFNVWLNIVYPVSLGLVAFISAFIFKYIIKSQDFDQQYKLATTDGLTELYNHRYFQEQIRMQVEHSKRYDSEFSLIILDIDFFKQFNDTFGHQAGDAVLRQVSQLIKSNVRSTDIVCRYGGEEISIILPNTAGATARSTAEKICKIVADKKFKLNYDRESNVTISLGVATFPVDGESASDLIDIADKRLYQSKHNGRNQVN